MAKDQRRYTDQERAALVAMLIGEGYPNSRGALQKVADYAKVSPDVLRRWFKRTQNPPPVTLVGQARATLADHLEDVAHELLNAIPAKLNEENLGPIVESLNTVIDKLQLLKGQPTEHTQHDFAGITDDERATSIAALLERARARRDGQPARRTDD